MKTVSALIGTVCDTLENIATCTCHMSSPVLSPPGRLPPFRWSALCGRPLVTTDCIPRRVVCERERIYLLTYLLYGAVSFLRS